MNPMRQPMIDFIQATIEWSDGKVYPRPLIRLSKPGLYPQLDFGNRFGTDRKKVLVWTDDRTNSEMAVEEAVDLFLQEKP